MGREKRGMGHRVLDGTLGRGPEGTSVGQGSRAPCHPPQQVCVVKALCSRLICRVSLLGGRWPHQGAGREGAMGLT